MPGMKRFTSACVYALLVDCSSAAQLPYHMMNTGIVPSDGSVVTSICGTKRRYNIGRR